MNREKEIQETFSDAQRLRLKTFLNLGNESELNEAVISIVETILVHHLRIAAKKSIPNRVKSKKKLLQIAAAARKLEVLLSDFDISRSIGNFIEEADIYPPELSKLFHRRPLWSDDEVSIRDMFGMLCNIELNATLLAKNDKSFSFHYMLPTVQEANRDFDANALWPRLFKFWEMAGNKVAATPEGPTFRFLALVHEVAMIKAPDPDALRSACERWRTDPMREQPEKIPWVA
ncbi:hypothetical protein FV222_04855 [Methylobacterium sp. WL103]|uniref:hypothetical protein n=1 Tax=Methylobacterium sp. WL103 TaxID=2603891 RepID=UPI0011C72B8E|nr:hypothetical protein [Methylobacterium sp. WL103]TXN06697.1 hypothetical protein FV222_04855 [Methylobacterium sp. WL103]